MKKLKHNKIRNTGLIFEILTKKFTSETLDGKDPISIKVIKKYYTKGSELHKELKLYEALNKPRKKFTEEFLNTCLQLRTKINDGILKEEKFQLIKTLKKHYDLKEFFNTRVGNYKLQASIFKLFECSKEENPEDYYSTKELVLEHLQGKDLENTKSEISELLQEDKHTLKLAFKYMVEEFNRDFSNLNTRQKQLLQEFINKDPNSDEFKKFIFNEVNNLVKRLKVKQIGVQDNVTKIKLGECISLSKKILESKVIRDEHLDSILKYYRLEEIL